MSTEIDIKTGLPKEMVRISRQKAKIHDLEQDSNKGLEARTAIKSKYGAFFERHCKDVLEKEIRDFLSKDPKCQVVLQILRSMGVEIQAAEYAQKVLDDSLGR